MTTVTSRFKVRDILEDTVELKEMNNGYIVFVDHADYLYDTPEIVDNLRDLHSGDTVKLTLESQNKKNTIWKITKIHDE